jgi:hypothetical protein
MRSRSRGVRTGAELGINLPAPLPDSRPTMHAVGAVTGTPGEAPSVETSGRTIECWGARTTSGIALQQGAFPSRDVPPSVLRAQQACTLGLAQQIARTGGAAAANSSQAADRHTNRRRIARSILLDHPSGCNRSDLESRHTP